MKKISIFSICLLALVAFAAWVTNVGAYPTYRNLLEDPPQANCSQCHPGFIGGFSGPLHGVHLNYTNGCESCHNAGPGSTPVLTDSSNAGAQPGCTGCHQGDGLQEHHTNAGAPPDGNGLTCAICHPDRSPVPEDVPPPYYGTAATSIEDPCSSDPPPGEDGAGDGGGLDNDGDLVYDEADPDCGGCVNDTDCDDGEFCTGAETCVDGTCVDGTPPVCDDGVDCTVDSCDEVNDACVNEPDDAVCDDGEFCTVGEFCDPDNDCQPGVTNPCNDGRFCTVDSCDEDNDVCVNEPDDSACADGINCTTDICDPNGPPANGGCVNDPVVCPPGEECDPFDGICKASGCTSDAECDNTVFCDGIETCEIATGNCLPGTPIVCDDGVDCTEDICDEAVDACANIPNDAACDDGDACTVNETCDPLNDCQPGDPVVCDDGNFCTTDSCDPVDECVFTPVECPLGQTCDPADGICKDSGCTSDAECDNTVFCDGIETCEIATGNCLPGTPVDCDDGVECTVDSCDEVNDVCENTPDDTFCPDDGLFCNGDEICDPELCADDDICDPEEGCVSTGDPCPAGTTCNEDTDTCDMVMGKVTICHIPPGNPAKAKTKSIDSYSVEDHLRHGDFLGPCQ